MTLSKGFPIHVDPGSPENRPGAKDLRKAFAGTVVRSASGVPRAGVFPEHTNGRVTGRADGRTVDVAAFVAVLTRGASDGVVFVSNDGVLQTPVAFDPAPASNSRIDVLWLKQNDSVDQADANDLPVWGIAKGTAAGLPVAPAVPSGALPITRALIPTGTTTSDEWTFTDVYPYTAAEGGTVLLRNAADETAWNPHEGSSAYRLDTATGLTQIGGEWVPDVVNHRFVRAIVGDSPVSTGARIGFIAGTITDAPPGVYRIYGRASMFSNGTVSSGFIYVKWTSDGGSASYEDARWDIPNVGTLSPSSPNVERHITHPGGDLVIEVGYRRDSGAYTVTGSASGLTVVEATRLG